MRDLHPIPLTHETIPRAYPLIQVLRPDIGRTEWQRLAESLLSSAEAGDRGIQSLQDARGFIAGVFVYQAAPTREHGRTLIVEDFVALDIIVPGRVAEALAREMESLARRLDCNAIHTAMPCHGQRAQSLLDILRAMGHRLDTLHLCKSLTDAR